jgi:peptidoglycan/LPS O-acetylase OafA/YrhL
MLEAGNHHSYRYIRDIDGLRAMAVLSVMLFHLKSVFLPGGFTGVDVFFVISGYVVSRAMVARGIRPIGQFLLDFFSRRFVRILPALFVCLAVTIALAILFIPQSWLSSSMNQAGVWAFFGASNIALLLYQDGYFSPRAEFNPFTHTWSLGVEEQFYLVLPFILLAWLKWRGRGAGRGLIAGLLLPVITVASLATAFWLGRDNPPAAYFLLPSRFWELAAGVMLFIAQYRGQLPGVGTRLATPALASGLVLACAGFWLADGEAFPFPWALLPVAGTVLCLYGVSVCRDGESSFGWLLGNPVVVYIGRISYSLYLWHWPVYALFRWTVGLEWQWMPLAVAITFICAALSYHLIEQPIRVSAWLKRRSPGLKVLIGTLLMASLAVTASHFFDKQKQLTLSVTGDVYTWYPWDHPQWKLPPGPKPLDGRKLYVVGNSHTPAYSTMLQAASDNLGIEVSKFPMEYCNVGNLLNASNVREGCEQPVADLLAKMKSDLVPGDMVFFASLRVKRLVDQWAAFDYEFGRTVAEIDDLPARARQRQSTTGILEFEDLRRYQLADGWAKLRREGLEETADIVGMLAAQGVHVLIDAPKPVFQIPPFRCSDWFNRANPMCLLGPEVDRQSLLILGEPIMDSLAELQRRFDNVIVWDPFPILCPTDPCSPYDQDGKPLFFDGDHLSAHGNRVLYPDFERLLLGVMLPKGTTGDQAAESVPVE